LSTLFFPCPEAASPTDPVLLLLKDPHPAGQLKTAAKPPGADSPVLLLVSFMHAQKKRSADQDIAKSQTSSNKKQQQIPYDQDKQEL